MIWPPAKCSYSTDYETPFRWLALGFSWRNGEEMVDWKPGLYGRICAEKLLGQIQESGRRATRAAEQRDLFFWWFWRSCATGLWYEWKIVCFKSSYFATNGVNKEKAHIKVIRMPMMSGISHPQFEVPTLDGTVLNWCPFWEQLLSLVYNNPRLGDFNKLTYLWNALKGGAAMYIF